MQCFHRIASTWHHERCSGNPLNHGFKPHNPIKASEETMSMIQVRSYAQYKGLAAEADIVCPAIDGIFEPFLNARPKPEGQEPENRD